MTLTVTGDRLTRNSTTRATRWRRHDLHALHG